MENQNHDWLRSLSSGAEIYNDIHGKLFFRKFKDGRVFACTDEQHLSLPDEMFVCSYQGAGVFHPNSLYPSNEERLAAIAEFNQKYLEAIAQEASHHKNRLSQMLFWLGNPEIKEFQLFNVLDIDGENTKFHILQLTEGHTIETVLKRLGMSEEEFLLQQFPCDDFPSNLCEGFAASEPYSEPFTYLRPSAEEIENYILERREMTYRNFSQRVTIPTPDYSFLAQG